MCGRPIDSLALVVSAEIAERTGSLNSKAQEPASQRRKSKELDQATISKFFNPQIEANKFVWYALLADWYRTDKAPPLQLRWVSIH